MRVLGRSRVRIPLGLIVCGFAVVVGIACEPAPPRFEVVARPLADPEAEKFVVNRQCAIDGVQRPVRGCPQILRAPAVEPLPDQTGVAAGMRRYKLWPLYRGRGLIVERWIAPNDRKQARRPLPTLVFRAVRGDFDIPFPVVEDGKIRTRFRLLPKTFSYQAEPLEVPAGAVLSGAVGIAPEVSTPNGPPMRFTVGVAGEASPLWESTIERADGAQRWHEYSLDLSALAGRSVTLEFSARPAVAPVRREVSLPVFSVPLLLAPERENTSPYNVILVSLDTLRADHVGAYGSKLPLTPNLDRVAAAGVVFEEAMTTFANTTASHMSLFTGLYPSVHDTAGPNQRLHPKIRTLPEYLAEEGFVTGAVTENGMISGGIGFGRGFDTYREYQEAQIAATSGHIDQVIDSGIAWLSRHRDEKTFLFLHSYEVHGPYTPPEGFDRFADEDTGFPMKRDSRAYAGEVLFADNELNRLFAALQEFGLYDKTILIVTADHGEGFGEKSVYHGQDLYEGVVRIPLIWHAPGKIVPGREGGVVSLVDVVPTLLEMLEVDTTHPVQGQSLAGAFHARGLADWKDRVVFAEHPRITAVRQGPRKWVLKKNQDDEVYDLARDPLEKDDLATPEILEQGQSLADAHRSASAALRASLIDRTKAAPVEIDRKTEGQLRALGYVE